MGNYPYVSDLVVVPSSHGQEMGHDMTIKKTGNAMSPATSMLLACLLVLSLTLLAQPASAAEFNLDDYAGKVVVLDFWASWCAPCRRSFPWLNTMHEKYADDGLVIVGVNLDLERDEAARFLGEFPALFRIVYDDDKELARRFEVIAMPSSYLIGRDGKTVEQHLGFKVKQQAEYEAAIVNALGQTGTGNE
jgi:thiol-disulfide isomerase/thioredoxin